ncbi:tetratricopeptide repeat protein [Maribacter sp. ANRC-HE7]|uniref:histidine kinase n=1 Tax=Maribacter aquimaris TaxID=2737171 RepID=A0ABR7UZR3_9FLAO|nr:tetratricopeptide repeat-containing sensor histidine kinase [Maribacter aquimaris]MBD0776511.1 tetratricopeptide repeat protein [Maribacter aquimaris]
MFILLCTAIGSCSFPSTKQDAPEITENDSILSWISLGRNSEMPLKQKTELLKKAYLAADNSTIDSVRSKYYSRLSLAYLEINDSLLFRSVNQKAISLSRKINDTITEANAHWDLADFFEIKKVMDSSFYHYSEAQKKFTSVGENYYSGRMFYNLAVIQTNVKDYTGAEINAFKSIELLKPLNEYLRLHRCYNLLGSITKELKEYDRSLEYFNIADEYLSEVDDEETKREYYSKLQNNLGNVYKDQGNYKAAKSYYQKATFDYDSLRYKDPSNYARQLNNLTLSRFKLGDTLNIFKDLETVKQIREEQNDIEGLSLLEYTYAEYYLSLKDTVNALVNARKAKQHAEQGSNNKRLLASLGLLARIDSKNHLIHTERYITLYDSLVQLERRERNKFTRIRFETDEFIAENESLTRKKQLWTGLALGIFLLGVSVYVIFHQRAKNQALRFQQQQQTSNQEIFDLMLSQKQKIAEIKKAEQKRISEELHDGVLGKMLGARMVLTGLNKVNTEEAISEKAKAISALKDVEGEVRAISHELSHAAYHNINNFINSIQELLKNICSANHLDYSFEFNETLDWDTMKGDIKINLYRMIQEILQNAVKHASCKNILVSFVRTNEEILVTITDDGKGFAIKSGKTKSGIGMRNIRSRIEKLGGTWNIDSALNKGTTITLDIPIKN